MPLIKYTASNVRGLNSKEILIDTDFLPYANLMNETANKYDIMIVVISSKRETIVVQGAIVEPATMSNHLIGHAWDVNLVVIIKNEYWNSYKLKNPTGVIKSFIDDVISAGMRWGGTFIKKDVVHFDDGLNIRNPELYIKKYNEYFPPPQA